MALKGQRRPEDLCQGLHADKPPHGVQSNLAIRLTTAAVASPLLLWLLFRGPAWGWYVMIFCATGIAATEVYAMTHPQDRVLRGLGVATSLVVSAGLYFGVHDARVLLTLLFGTTIVSVLVPVLRPGEIPSAAGRLLAQVAAPWYLALLTPLALLRSELGTLGPGYVLMTLMFAWMADTWGYFVGRRWGKTPLYPSVSPKKTREGFVGAFGGALFGSCLAHFWYLPQIPLVNALVLGAVAGLLGQAGDLAESLLKRSTAVKDSGSIVPGHGGLLDRIDALLIASSVVYTYTLWFAHQT
ncbi:MAG TPA: phosphatidate cytidylyltransferase [Polyangiaceae bacterium]|nr:phosphatidate cytidylyltransferase [Polyangiaceae bacterium]